MALELDNVGSGFNLSKLNANFAKIEDSINNDTLRRDVEVGDANEMRTFLDMNTNRIVNSADGVDPQDLVTKSQLDEVWARPENLDMRDFQIINLKDGVAPQDAITLKQLEEASVIGVQGISTLGAVARSLNVEDSEVILAADTVTVLDDVLYIYASPEETTWSIPTLDSNGKTVVSVSPTGELVTTGGTGSDTYQLTTINKSGIEFNVIADIDTLQSVGGKLGGLLVGDSITVLDYATGNNSGVLFFKVVASGTGVDDGGKFIDLPTLGLQLQQNLKAPYDPKAWGAVGDGVADDGDELHNCHQAQRAASVDMHIPAGHYISNRTIGSDGEGSIVITGAGEGLTKVSFETIETGFRFGFGSPVSSVEMKDMEITTNTQSNSFAAIYANHVPGSRPCSNFENLFIHGVDGNGDINTGNWFQRGIQLINSQQPTIDNCKFMGAFATNPTEAARAEAAIKIEADTGATIPRITKCWSLNYSSGVKIRNTSQAARIEGIYISDCDWVFVNSGVDIVFDQSPAYYAPQVTINNMHTEAFLECIHIEGCAEVKISDTLLYAFNSTAPAYMINLVNCNDVKVYDNHIIGRPNNTINLEGVRAENCNLVQVYDNEISTNGAHIVSTGTTQNMSELGNIFKGSGLRTADTSPNASTNKIGFRYSFGSNESFFSYYTQSVVKEQGGTTVVSLDGSGNATIAFPTSFTLNPSVLVSNGDANLSDTVVNSRNATTTNFAVNVPGASNISYSVSWRATGI